MFAKRWQRVGGLGPRCKDSKQEASLSAKMSVHLKCCARDSLLTSSVQERALV